MTAVIVKEKQGVGAAVEKLGFKPPKKVLIKPNLVGPYPGNSGIVTNPLVMDQLIEWLLERDVEVIVGESSAYGRDTKKSLEVSGIGKILEKHSVKFVDLKKKKQYKKTG